MSTKEELVKKLEKIIDRKYKVIDQVAGVRPTVPDRKPLVGKHPAYSNLFVCNGFGSRGVLIGPAVVQELFAFMEEKKPLSKEIDVRRF